MKREVMSISRIVIVYISIEPIDQEWTNYSPQARTHQSGLRNYCENLSIFKAYEELQVPPYATPRIQRETLLKIPKNAV
jgi:hypothetical protein